MTLIQSVKNYIETYAGLKENAPLWVNYLGAEPTEYAIVPLPGDRILEAYITGKERRAYPFAFQSMERTADELERLENIGFYETFAAWLDSQSEAGVLPTLDSGLTAEKIEAVNWGYLFEQGESSSGVYQIQCRLIYEQEP